MSPSDSALTNRIGTDMVLLDRWSSNSLAGGRVRTSDFVLLHESELCDFVAVDEEEKEKEEHVTGESKSYGLGFVDGEKKRKRGGLDGDETCMVMVSSEKFGFDKRRMGESVRVEDEEIAKLGKKESFDSVILNEATDSAGSCVALRTKTRKELEKEVENPVPAYLDETKSDASVINFHTERR